MNIFEDDSTRKDINKRKMERKKESEPGWFVFVTRMNERTR